ncbi:Extracellular ligand-binding receptor [Fulvivirga imtechensis AK7]|uniref:Extracellular ligand-binding receptor n=1 Tax=Fulvivirga imtechensis AK7 TaxID=1237149 RepID=L8JQA4_9BACT|nr:ABC transporter substrate-binding protein [Fulvivirga imtechensis]ELR71136.1 Extracellular ligand-binding receptor [Fulvivirga imtechensis AK7]
MRRLFIITLFICSNLYSQDNEISDLDIRELAAVDVEKSSMPIQVDSTVAFSGKTINLGLIMPFSSDPEYTQELQQGAQMAIDEINDSGGILGKKLYLISADDGGDGNFAVEKAKELIVKYQVTSLIGPMSSTNTIKIAREVLHEYPAVLISPNSTSTRVSKLDDKDLIFRTTSTDIRQGKIAASFAANKLGLKTAALFYMDDYHGEGLANEFRNNFEKYGGKIVGEDRLSPLVNPDNYDLIPHLRKVLKEKPDVLYVVCSVDGISNMSYQIEEGGLFKDHKPVLIGSDAIKYSQLLEKADLTVIEGMYGTAFKSLAGTEFERKFEKWYGRKPVAEGTADAYDIVYLLTLAMLDGQSTVPNTIATHLRKVSQSGQKVTADDFKEIEKLIRKGKDINYSGINSSLDFDEFGDVPDRTYWIWQIVNGKFERDLFTITE